MSNMKSETNRRSPIDHGYAWLIAFAAGMSFFIGAGLVKTYTFVYEALLEKFGHSATETALVASLHSGIKMCSSPIVSALVNRYGNQRVTIAGGLIAFVGSLMSAFPPSLYFMYFSHSFVSAIGSNMVICCAFVMVGQYFKEKRSTAMGLASSCAGLGGFAMALLLTFLFDYYGYSGTMLLYAGLTLHYIAVGLIYQPVPAKYLSDWKAKSPDNPTDTNPQNDTMSDIMYRSNLSLNAPGSVSFEPHTPNQSINSIASQHKQSDNTELRVRMSERSLSVESKGANRHDEDILIQMFKRSISAEPTTHDQQDKILNDVIRSVANTHGPEVSNEDVHEHDKSDALEVATANEETTVGTDNSFCANVSKQFGLHMLKNADFIALMLLMFGVFFTFSCGQFLFGLGKEILGLTGTEIAFVLSVASAFEILSRPVCGVIFDLPIVRPHKKDLWILAGLLCGTSLIILPFSNSFAMFFVMWILYVMFASILHVQQLDIISDLVGSKNLASAMGLMRFSMGLGLLLGPTLGGMLKDRYDTYLYSFILLGSSIVVFFTVFKLVECTRSILKSKS